MCPHCISITEALLGIVTARAFEQLFTTFADLLILEHMFPATLLQDPLLRVRARQLTVALAVMFLMLNLVHIGAMIVCGVYASFAGEFPLPPSPLLPLSPPLPTHRAGREFLRSAAAYRLGDNSTGAKLLLGANRYNDYANNIQGVSVVDMPLLPAFE
jgi:hypothetical protein